MLPDLLPHNPDLLFCGTAAGRASAARGHYYAGPGNRFWQMLAETGMTARLALGDKTLRSGALAADPRWPGVALWALRSPSGAARGHFSAQPWQALAAALGAVRANGVGR